MDLAELKIKLEFDRITGSVKHHAYSTLGEVRCDEIDFFTDNESLEKELDKVVEMKIILSTEGDLPLDGLKDISRCISKIKIEMPKLTLKIGGLNKLDKMLKIKYKNFKTFRK